MGRDSKIEWTATIKDDGTTIPGCTFNPWRGCSKVSEGCAFFYAERESKRFGLDLWGSSKERPRTSANYWKQPYKWDAEAQAAGVRKKVFCASFADVGEDRDDVREARRDLQILIERTPNLDWLLLTKRPENMVRLFARWQVDWPANAWVGTSAENQVAADKRIPELLKVPASIRFLSAEPLIGPITFRPTAQSVEDMFRLSFQDEVQGGPMDGAPAGTFPAMLKGIHWLIAGGESGSKARLMDLEWVRPLREQCRVAGTAFFMKQLGGWPDKKDQLEDFPEDLRIREFPK